MKEVIKELFPPDVKPLLRWRIAMFIAVSILMLDSLWGAGGLAPIGALGYARAAEVQQLARNVDTILILQLQERMRNIHDELCNATTQNARNLLEGEIAILQEEHRSVTGSYYPIPRGCPEQ